MKYPQTFKEYLNEQDDDVGVITKDPEVKRKDEVKQPRMYIVLLHNDDYTPPEIVIDILQRVFNINQEGATRIMMLAHTRGSAAVGKWPRDIAETKAYQATKIANDEEFPLYFTAEVE